MIACDIPRMNMMLKTRFVMENTCCSSDEAPGRSANIDTQLQAMVRFITTGNSGCCIMDAQVVRTGWSGYRQKHVFPVKIPAVSAVCWRRMR